MEEITTKKGFKVLKVNLQEMHEKLNSPGICMGCNEIPFKGYLVSVLNDYMCESCFIEWQKNATYYEEDKGFEERTLEYYKTLLRRKMFE